METRDRSNTHRVSQRNTRNHRAHTQHKPYTPHTHNINLTNTRNTVIRPNNKITKKEEDGAAGGLDLAHRLRGQDEATACCVAHVCCFPVFP